VDEDEDVEMVRTGVSLRVGHSHTLYTWVLARPARDACEVHCLMTYVCWFRFPRIPKAKAIAPAIAEIDTRVGWVEEYDVKNDANGPAVIPDDTTTYLVVWHQ
jgi:hypothetical protein